MCVGIKKIPPAFRFKPRDLVQIHIQKPVVFCTRPISAKCRLIVLNIYRLYFTFSFNLLVKVTFNFSWKYIWLQVYASSLNYLLKVSYSHILWIDMYLKKSCFIYCVFLLPLANKNIWNFFLHSCANLLIPRSIMFLKKWQDRPFI